MWNFKQTANLPQRTMNARYGTVVDCISLEANADAPVCGGGDR